MKKRWTGMKEGRTEMDGWKEKEKERKKPSQELPLTIAKDHARGHGLLTP